MRSVSLEEHAGHSRAVVNASTALEELFWMLVEVEMYVGMISETQQWRHRNHATIRFTKRQIAQVNEAMEYAGRVERALMRLNGAGLAALEQERSRR